MDGQTGSNKKILVGAIIGKFPDFAKLTEINFNEQDKIKCIGMNVSIFREK